MDTADLIKNEIASIALEADQCRQLVAAHLNTPGPNLQNDLSNLNRLLDSTKQRADRLQKLTAPTQPISVGAVLLAMAGVVAATWLGFVASLALNDWSFVGRAGALITIIGLLLLGWQVLQTRARTRATREKISVSGGFANEAGPVLAFIDWSNSATFGALTGLAISVFGTLVWGFGDLVARLQ